MVTEGALKDKYEQLSSLLDERSLRLCAASDALALGYGGASLVARASGLSRSTIYAGIQEINGKPADSSETTDHRVRKSGGGRKRIKEKDKKLARDLDELLDPVTRGDPMSPLRWTCKSTTKLAAELRVMNHQVSQATVWRLLDEMGYSMQSNRKRLEGTNHEDRNRQFEYVNESVKWFFERELPVISVDTKKKELIGTSKNAGREWEEKGKPVAVNVHDFVDKKLGKVIPYGVYDIARNEGWVNVGVTHDTAEFTVESIHRWWKTMGRQVYPNVGKLLITADGGGSNGSRPRLWTWELQRLATKLNMVIQVRHFPPGTSKWNKIEHRMFNHITQNWRGQPLASRMTVVNLISNTRTSQGLSIQAELDETEYEKGKKITDQQMDSLAISRDDFHGEWNYEISPPQ